MVAIRAFVSPDPSLDPFKIAYLTTFLTNFAPGLPSGSSWRVLIFTLRPSGGPWTFLALPGEVSGIPETPNVVGAGWLQGHPTFVGAGPTPVNPVGVYQVPLGPFKSQ